MDRSISTDLWLHLLFAVSVLLGRLLSFCLFVFLSFVAQKLAAGIADGVVFAHNDLLSGKLPA